MRYVIAILLTALLALVHIKLWWGGDSSYAYTQTLAQQQEALKTSNEVLRIQNAALKAELKDIEEGTQVIEDHARNELGMVKPDEVMVILKKGS